MNFDIFKRRAREIYPCVVFSDGENPEVMRAASNLSFEKIIHPILLGAEERIMHQAKKKKIFLESVEIITPLKSHLFHHYLNEMILEHGQSKQVEMQLRSPEYFATMMLKHTQADAAILSGNPLEYFKLVRQIIGLKNETPRISSSLLFYSDSFHISITDPFFDFEYTTPIITDIAVETAKSHFLLTEEMPEIVFLNNEEDFSEEKSVTLGETAAEMLKHVAPQIKAFSDTISNLSNYFVEPNNNETTLVFPNKRLAQLTYQMLISFSNFQAIGPVIHGLKMPYFYQEFKKKSYEIELLAIAAALQLIK